MIYLKNISLKKNKKTDLPEMAALKCKVGWVLLV